ncbi:MAG: single-stranded DNA-binding protein [Ornithinimicrobium sp.]|uniref:single-stranded DNA-binding protein n=1 Tax=Ornithinimicrobium sp. TaxID=1977084 RepID=UPI0026DEB555|nr:single-stranded DNA-binding protein [Ornithinimicrobium sp.]MDO5738925.1 single-stranded DNA-binding protein [Ornithinimicrobium sp.]
MLNEMKMAVSGNITRPPELKHRKIDGRPFAVVPIAVNERRFDRDKQQWIELGTTFYDIICGNGLGANALACLDVGMPVVAYGKFRLHEWATETGKGFRPTITAESIGVDLTWGTTSYAKGSKTYAAEDEYAASAPPPEEGGPPDWTEGGQWPSRFVTEDGIEVDHNGEVHGLTGASGEDIPADGVEPQLAAS